MTDDDAPMILEFRLAPRPGGDPAHKVARVRDALMPLPPGIRERARHDDDVVIQASSLAAVSKIVDVLQRARLEVDVGEPVPLGRATLHRTGEAEHRIDGDAAMPGAFAAVRLRVVPLQSGGGIRFESEFEGPPPIDAFNAAVEQAVRRLADFGLDGRHPLIDLRVIFTGGSFHPSRSSREAFAAAATHAMRAACAAGGIRRLVPMMKCIILAPRDDVRAIVADLHAGGGREVRRMLSSHGVRVEADIALSVVRSYADRLAKLTDRRARLEGEPVFGHFA